MNLRLAIVTLAAAALHAETGYDAWLRYVPVPGIDPPAVVATLDNSPLAQSAQSELIRGFRGMSGRILRAQSGVPGESAIVLGTLSEIPRQWRLDAQLAPESFWLKSLTEGSRRFIVIAAPDARGLLYGAFALLRHAALGESLANLDRRESPAAPVRWVNQWDNLDGIDRARLRRPLHFLGRPARARRSQPRQRLRPPAGLARHQRLLHQ